MNTSGRTYDEVTSGGGLDQTESEAVVWLLQHVEGLSVGQIAENIHGEVIAPVTHDARRRPALLLVAAILRADLLAEGPDILQDVALDAPHGRVREGLAQDSPLPRVQRLVPGVVGVGDGVGEGIVELGLADVGLEAVDVLEGGVGVEGDAVGAEADDGAVLLVEAPELEVPVALVGVVELVGVGELGDDGAGVLGERVEEDAVDAEREGLRGSACLHTTVRLQDMAYVGEASTQKGGCQGK